MICGVKRRIAWAGLILANCWGNAQALDLLESYRLALANDSAYRALQAEADAGREVLPQAEAQFLPNLSASISRSKSQTDSTQDTIRGPYRQNNTYFGDNQALTLRQPIYRKYLYANYKQAESQVNSIDANLEKARRDLIVTVAGAYFDALQSRHHLALIHAQKSFYSTQLEAARRAFELGQGTRTDIDDAQSRYDFVLYQELEAQQSSDHIRRRLEKLIQQPAGEIAELDSTRFTPMATQKSREEWAELAYAHSPELQSLRASVEVARQEVEKARAGHTPTLDLVAQRRKSASDSETSINSQYLTTTLSLQLNIPLYAGGYVNSTVRQALSNLEKIELRQEDRRREIALEVEKHYRDITEGMLKIKALEQAERSADQSVSSNEKGYQAGTRTRIDILNAEQLRFNTKRDLSLARFQYVLANIRLRGLAGALDEAELEQFNRWLKAF